MIAYKLEMYQQLVPPTRSGRRPSECDIRNLLEIVREHGGSIYAARLDDHQYHAALDLVRAGLLTTRTVGWARVFTLTERTIESEVFMDNETLKRRARTTLREYERHVRLFQNTNYGPAVTEVVDASHIYYDVQESDHVVRFEYRNHKYWFVSISIPNDPAQAAARAIVLEHLRWFASSSALAAKSARFSDPQAVLKEVQGLIAQLAL